MCLLLAVCFTCTLTGSALAKEKEEINSNTVITNENIGEVLEYLGLDSSSFTVTDENQTGVKTVGELKQAIAQFNQLPKTINDATIVPISEPANFTSNKTDFSTNAVGTATVGLLYRLNVDTYDVEYTASGTYSGYNWISCSSPDATAETDSLIYSFKVTQNDLVLTISGDKRVIAMVGTIRVDHYLGVGGYGLVNIGYQVINSAAQWNVTDYAY
jgi:hypothetical protein